MSTTVKMMKAKRYQEWLKNARKTATVVGAISLR